jgi:hypothetical protein
LPAVFVPEPITIAADANPEPIELRAHPHVTVEVQFYNSKGEISAGHAPHLWGRFDGKFFSVRTRPVSKGKYLALAPHGLEQAKLDLITNEHSALSGRISKDAPLSRGRELELGTLDRDLAGVEVIRYVAPVLLVRGVDEHGAPVKDVRVSAMYVKPTGTGAYILPGGIHSDVSFEQQEDGRYRSEQLQPDEEVKVTVTAEGYEKGEEALSLAEGATQELNVTLKRSKQ